MRVLLFVALLLGLAFPLKAQTTIGVASLKADQITVTSGYRTLRAKGNVEIVYQSTILTATEIVYNADQDRIIAVGPIRIQDGDAVTILADYAELSADMRRGVLKSARMVLNEQLQLTAVEINRQDARYNQLFMAAASTCTVSLAKPTPFWQIRAKRIIQDEENKQLYFENAQVRIGPVPVAYLPRLRVPDPTVTRATGFLVPGLSNSDRYGAGVTIPYFRLLGDYADTTLTPTIMTTGTFMLGIDFRKRFQNGRLDIESSLTRDTVASQKNRGHIFVTGSWTLGRNTKLGLSIEHASDLSYLNDLGISAKTRLENKLSLERTDRRARLGIGLYTFRNLSPTVSTVTIPHLLGTVEYRRRIALGASGGELGVELGAYGYQRRSTADIVGRDGRRLSVALDWEKRWISGGGAIFSTRGELHAANYRINQDSGFPTPVSTATPILAADWRLPLARQTARATDILEPRVQLVWSPNSGTTGPNEDSQLVEFGAENLFALNRFTGIDVIERGLRANIGLTLDRQTNSGWNLNAVAGRVLRINTPAQFGAFSGLSANNSAFVLAGQISLPDRFRLIQRMVFGDGNGLLKNETRIGYKADKFDVTTSYLWLQQNAAGNTTADHSEWIVDTGWALTSKWRSGASWRYDLENNAASDAGLSLSYVNDCIKVDLSLSRRFAASSNVGPSTSLGFMVTLEGFGARADSDAYNRKCSGL